MMLEPGRKSDQVQNENPLSDWSFTKSVSPILLQKIYRNNPVITLQRNQSVIQADNAARAATDT